MFMVLFYLLLGGYLLYRGGGDAGFWASNNTAQGLLMLLAGLFLILAQVM